MLKSIISKLMGNKGEVKMEDNKIVCGCYKVTEADLNKAVKNGAKSFEEVQEITKVGTGCGHCIENNRALVNNLILTNKINENPIVCGCFKVTVQDVNNAIKNGAKSFEEVQEITKVGTGCGHCIDSNKELVKLLLERQ